LRHSLDVARTVACLLCDRLEFNLRGWDLSKVKHIIIIIMQENHSFDNYLESFLMRTDRLTTEGPVLRTTTVCVDGLDCQRNPVDGKYQCHNSNREAEHKKVFAFHSSDFCVLTDLDHSWNGTHQEANFLDPNAALRREP